MKTLYQYTIKTGGGETHLTGWKEKMPIVVACEDAQDQPIVAAGLLRDLAKWAIEQAEIIEETETGKSIQQRFFGGNYAAQIVEVST